MVTHYRSPAEPRALPPVEPPSDTIFPTGSKPGHPGAGVALVTRLHHILAATPIFAIGGLAPERVGAVLLPERRDLTVGRSGDLTLVYRAESSGLDLPVRRPDRG